ncbi:MAG: alpha/beta fold hydrolase [Burkholderiaceae bacterium]
MGAIVVSFRSWSAAAWRILLRNAVLCGLAATLTGCAWLDTKQRELVFRPTPGRPADFVGLRPGDVTTLVDVPWVAARSVDQVQLWWLPHPDPHAPTLLYLHGTFRNLYQNIRKVESLRAAGFSIVAVEYRGWGDSSAIIPSEATIYADAKVAWDELVRRQSAPRKRVIFGHSMGSGVAVELASHRHVGVDYGGLILESSFTRLPDVAKAFGTVGTIASWFASMEFDSRSKIDQVDAPILMLHGTADHTVPIALGRRLFEAAPPQTQWIEFAGGSHSGLDRESPDAYRYAIHSLIDRLEPTP